MFQSLVITLREGVEAALIVGIVLGYLQKTGRREWGRYVYWGLFTAVLASLTAAWIVHRLQVTEDVYEGWLMLVGAVFVASMVYWMWRTGKRLKQEIETRLSKFSSSSSYAAPLGVFLFVFLMVLREGVETVLFLAAVSLRTTELLNFMGGVIGLAMAIGLGVAFFKGSLKVDLKRFFAVTSLLLFVVAAQLLVSGIHELSEAQVLPSSRREMALVGPIVNNDAFFFVVIVALAVFLIIAHRIKTIAPGDPQTATASGPQRRKALAEQKREHFWKLSATAAGMVVILLISAQFIYSRTAQPAPTWEPIALVDGEAVIPVSPLTDHKLHLYSVPVEGTPVHLMAILDATDTVRAALDACAICGTQGYHQDGQNVICNNCAAAINIPTIGVAGGCNPIHIDYRVEGESLRIPAAVLQEARKAFNQPHAG